MTIAEEKKENLLKKIADYALATGKTVEDAVDAIIDHIKAREADIEASESEKGDEAPKLAQEAPLSSEATDTAEAPKETTQTDNSGPIVASSDEASTEESPIPEPTAETDRN